MASADSDRFSAIFTQVESLHKQGMDQRHPRGSQIFARRFFFALVERGVMCGHALGLCLFQPRVGVS
jgi:hypothetical protein